MDPETGAGQAGSESDGAGAPGYTEVGAGQAGSVSGISGASAAPIETIPGERAMLSPQNGHVALIPEDVPPAVQAMVAAGNELQDLPYGPAGHPDPRGGHERGLLEHGQLRALPRRRAPPGGNRAREPPRPGLRRLGRSPAPGGG